jgi:cytochrome P450
LNQIEEITTGSNDNYKDRSNLTIFHSILSSKLPEPEKSITRLSDDAQVLMMAGTLTTAWVLEVTTFWLLSLPLVLCKLKEELAEVILNPEDIGKIPLPVLEIMPYLNAVMKEGFRLSYGVSCRLARIDPDNPIQFTDRDTGKKYTIPPRTPVGMTNVQIHHDESLFPNSKAFDPERWLRPNSKSLEKYMVSFTGGSRQCLGINLAHAELYLALSAIWRQWGSSGENGVRGVDDVGVLELYETGLRDVEIESDAFLPIPQKGSKGIRLKLF